MSDKVLVGFAASDLASGSAVGEVVSVVYVDPVKLSDPAATLDLMPEVRVRQFPNPAREAAVLFFQGLEVADVQVFDPHGRRIAGFHQPRSPLLLDLGRFTAGNYIVRVVGKGGAVVVRF